LTVLGDRFGAAETIYPGHGDPGPAGQQISEQRNYLRTFRRLVRPAVTAESAGGAAVTPEEVTAELDRIYPNYPRVRHCRICRNSTFRPSARNSRRNPPRIFRRNAAIRRLHGIGRPGRHFPG
jgi:hypothetical protein